MSAVFPNVKQLIFPIVFILLVGLGLHLWNNDVPAIPAALARLVPGQASVKDFLAAAGPRCQKVHDCTRSELYIHLDDGSAARARCRVMFASYLRPDTRMHRGAFLEEEEANWIITGIRVVEWCPIDDSRYGPLARALVALSDCDRSLVTDWRTDLD